MISRTDAVLALVCLAACRRSPDMGHDRAPPPSDRPLASSASSIDAPPMPPPAPAPDVDLGPDLTPIAFAPGHYASLIQVSARGTHAMQVVRESSTASFVLDLAADGTATACRGWRYEMTNDGPEVHTEDHQEVQQGYAGTYTLAAGVATISLAPSAAPCAAHNAYREFTAEPLSLRAVLATPHAGSTLPSPTLVLQWLSPAPRTNPGAHHIPGAAPAGWFVLGSGNGVRAKLTGAPASPNIRGAPPATVIDTAPAAVAPDSWKQAF
jgi:hypothetical protein